MMTRRQKLVAGFRIALSTMTFLVAGLVFLPVGHSQVPVYPWSLVATWNTDNKLISCITCQPVYMAMYTYSTPAECKACHSGRAFPESPLEGASPCVR